MDDELCAKFFTRPPLPRCSGPPVRNYRVAGYIVEPLHTLTLARVPRQILHDCEIAFGMGVFGFISARNIRQLLTELFFADIHKILVREVIQKRSNE